MDIQVMAILALAAGFAALLFVIIYQMVRGDERTQHQAIIAQFLMMTRAVRGMESELRALRKALGVHSAPLDAPFWWAPGQRAWPPEATPPKQTRASPPAVQPETGPESANYPRENLEPLLLPDFGDDDEPTQMMTKLSPATPRRST